MKLPRPRIPDLSRYLDRLPTLVSRGELAKIRAEIAELNDALAIAYETSEGHEERLDSIDETFQHLPNFDQLGELMGSDDILDMVKNELEDWAGSDPLLTADDVTEIVNGTLDRIADLIRGVSAG